MEDNIITIKVLSYEKHVEINWAEDFPRYIGKIPQVAVKDREGRNVHIKFMKIIDETSLYLEFEEVINIITVYLKF